MTCLAAVASLIVACSNGDPTYTEPQRPASVPTDTRYIGGTDGGVYVSVQHRNGGQYDVVVYLDSGFVAYRGGAVVSGEARNALTADDVLGWDGEKLLLESGGALVPSQSVKPIEVD